MIKISRYILVAIAILVSAVAIPKLYWLSFDKPIRSPFIMYSSIDHDFMIQRTGEKTIRMDNTGREYTRDEFEQKLPLFYSRQLLISGTMPDTIDGVYMDIHELNKARSFFRLRPAMIYAPDPGLYPMFESESGRANLEMPKDYFRISWRMEFIDAADNRINEKKSRMFTSVLQKRGFVFPAKKIAGIPTTRKSCDEGYFVTDSKDQLFHIKMIEARPFVKKVELPGGLKFKHIACVDFSDKKFYNYLVSEDNDIYVLSQDVYELTKLAIENYNADTEELRIYGNLFYYNVVIRGDNYVNVTILDSDYNKVDEYHESWTGRTDSKQGKIFSYIFPAQLKMYDSNISFTDFYPDITKGFNWLILNLLLILVHFYIIRKKGFSLKNNIFDLIIVALTGLFGFIAVNVFPNKSFA